MPKSKQLPTLDNDNDLEEYKRQLVSLSNNFIRSKEYTNLLESKIEVLAIYRMDQSMKQRQKKDAAGNPYLVNYVDLSSSEIRKLMGRKDGETYREIRKAAHFLKSKVYIVEDRENGRFYMKSMYADVIYDKGMLSIEFEPGMEKYFMNLKDNYTRLKLATLFSFKKIGGLQLYKLLRSYVYPPNLEPINMALKQEELPVLKMSWSVAELRMIMGYVNINQAELQDEGRKSNPDWDKMVRDEKKPQYKRWSDFKTRVIDPGIEEINKISDIYICGMDKELSGHGGKTTRVTFYIQHNRAYYEANQPIAEKQERKQKKPVLTEEQKDEFIDEIWDMMKEEGLKLKDLKAIAEASEYDMEKIQKCYAISRYSNINNMTGWMIKALQDNYEEPKASKRRKESESWERDYDFTALEEELLNHSRRGAAKAI